MDGYREGGVPGAIRTCLCNSDPEGRLIPRLSADTRHGTENWLSRTQLQISTRYRRFKEATCCAKSGTVTTRSTAEGNPCDEANRLASGDRILKPFQLGGVCLVS